MDITVISKPDCGYCLRAKHLLNKLELPFTELRLGVDISREDVVDKYPIMKTLPIIVINGALVGGYTQLEQRCESGKLDLTNLC